MLQYPPDPDCALRDSVPLAAAAQLAMLGGELSVLHTLCYVLAGVYGALSLWSAYKLLQLWRASAGLGVGFCRCCGAWSSQRTLHLLLLLVGVGACAHGGGACLCELADDGQPEEGGAS